MCGILGGMNAAFDAQSLRRLQHRGPDQSAISHRQYHEKKITLGQTRLNIIDSNNISLPVQGGDATIVFNGQIYNHQELRRELKSFGWEFQTPTDIETALVSYLQWGEDCPTRFNGMFAFAIYDGRRFFCARDRLGEKPFYYRAHHQRFEFASELKAFSELEYAGNDSFDLFEFCHAEQTLFRGILSLPPAHTLVYDCESGACCTRRYWSLDDASCAHINSDRQAIDEFIQLLTDSIRLRIKAEAEVALFLSGGLDSSLIAALSGVPRALTCQFEELRDSIDEETFASDLCRRLKIRHRTITPTRAEFLRDLPALGHHLEMPTGSLSAFPLYRLARAAKNDGAKVVLSGEGSDEIFAGYARNELLLNESASPASATAEHYSSMLRRYHGDTFDRFCRMASRSGLIGAGLMKMRLANLWSPGRTDLQNICNLETRVFLQPLLQMADRMCMAHGVENRSPFLDHRIVEFAFALPDRFRFRDGVGKWLVHETAQKLLPKGSLVLQRKVKHGLPTPVNQWLFGISNFDRRHWNAMMLAECIRAMMGAGEILTQKERPVQDVPMAPRMDASLTRAIEEFSP